MLTDPILRFSSIALLLVYSAMVITVDMIWGLGHCWSALKRHVGAYWLPADPVTTELPVMPVTTELPVMPDLSYPPPLRQTFCLPDRAGRVRLPQKIRVEGSPLAPRFGCHTTEYQPGTGSSFDWHSTTAIGVPHDRPDLMPKTTAVYPLSGTGSGTTYRWSA